MGCSCAAGAVRERNAQGRMVDGARVVEAGDTDDDAGLAYAFELFMNFEGGGIHSRLTFRKFSELEC